MNISTIRVANKYLRIADVKSQANRFKSEAKNFLTAFENMAGNLESKSSGGDQNLKQLVAKAKGFLSVLDITLEDPVLETAFKSSVQFRLIERFQEIITAYSLVDTLEDFRKIYNKGLSWGLAAEDYLTMSQMIHDMISHMDSEVPEVIRVLDYTCTLINVPTSKPWDRDKVAILEGILEKTNRILSSGGFSKSTGGKVYAYTPDSLPIIGVGANVDAAYRSETDDIHLAIGRGVEEVTESLVHELGHRVYFKNLGAQGRSEWVNFFKSNSGPPDTKTLFKSWKDWIQSKTEKTVPVEARSSLSGYAYHLNHTHNSYDLMWWEMIAQKLNLDPEDRDGYNKALAQANKIQAFLYPVTAYSMTNPEELFAEVFSHWMTYGARTVPEIVRDAFSRAVPSMRTASSSRLQ